MVMRQIYSDPNIHHYLRMNPKWYRVLKEKPEYYEHFMNEYKESTGQTAFNKINKLNNQINFITNMIKYLNK